ncbi:MAG TPA: phosphoenolpyruvate--protein phosphotransferase [Rhodospirillaceae bacterium]|nr:phosphoenolpyruvate--protein phosphotransferase [Rhodospirillaceae bacterium]
MSPDRREKILRGIGVSHGIAIGPAFLVQLERPRVPEWKIAAADVKAEQSRFQSAVMSAQTELGELKEQSAHLPETAAEEIGLLLDAHLAMLSGSRLVRGVLKRIEAEGINAEAAIEHVMQELTDQFRALKDKYIAARIDDVEAVSNRLIRILMNLPYIALDSVPPGGIVLAKEISPADTALMDPKRFAGIATVHGGAAGHTAVMARSLGIPAVLSVDGAMLDSGGHGGTAIVDGVAGVLILNPSEATLAEYRARQQALQNARDDLDKIIHLPAEMADGTAVSLRANLELPRDAEAIVQSGADGIGLFRTEFLFMNRSTLPDEEEQYESMVAVVRTMTGRSVTFRTLDIGGDKIARAMGAWIAEATNPALGLRAIRLSLKRPELLTEQFRAMLRAAAHGPVRILLPMVTTAEEVEQAAQLLRRCHADLKAEGKAVPEALPPLGTMIEIPAAALSADSLAAVSDFFALGTNDLVQYTVAIDRGNDQVAALYNPLNPAVLRLIEFTLEAARRAGIPVSICGEMGADPLYTPLLLGLGLREFSVGSAALPRIKQRIRSLRLADAEAHARAVMDQYDPAQIKAIVEQFGA